MSAICRKWFRRKLWFYADYSSLKQVCSERWYSCSLYQKRILLWKHNPVVVRGESLFKSLPWPVFFCCYNNSKCRTMSLCHKRLKMSESVKKYSAKQLGLLWRYHHNDLEIEKFLHSHNHSALSLNNNKRAILKSTGQSRSTPSKEKHVRRYNQYSVILIGRSYYESFSRKKTQFWACEDIVWHFSFKFIMLD